MLRPSRALHIYAFTIALHFCHAQPLLLAPQRSLSHLTLFTLSIHPIRGLPLGLTPLTSDLHQMLFFQSLHMPKPPQHSLLCLISQLPYNPSSPSHFLISHLIHSCYSTHTLLRHLIFITFSLLLSADGRE